MSSRRRQIPCISMCTSETLTSIIPRYKFHVWSVLILQNCYWYEKERAKIRNERNKKQKKKNIQNNYHIKIIDVWECKYKYKYKYKYRCKVIIDVAKSMNNNATKKRFMEKKNQVWKRSKSKKLF